MFNMFWGCSDMLKAGEAWMWSPADEKLSCFCLVTTSFLVLETFKFKNFEM